MVQQVWFTLIKYIRTMSSWRWQFREGHECERELKQFGSTWASTVWDDAPEWLIGEKQFYPVSIDETKRETAIVWNYIKKIYPHMSDNTVATPLDLCTKAVSHARVWINHVFVHTWTPQNEWNIFFVTRNLNWNFVLWSCVETQTSVYDVHVHKAQHIWVGKETRHQATSCKMYFACCYTFCTVLLECTLSQPRWFLHSHKTPMQNNKGCHCTESKKR